jgi:DNA-binding Lrp family transcriptional regulator
VEIDDLDLALMEQLKVDGRASFEALGSAVGLSRNAARDRVNRLLQSGSFRIVATVHPFVEGIRVFGSVFVSVQHAAASSVAELIAAIPAATFVSIVSGRYPIVAELRAGDMDQWSETVSSIREIAGVDIVDALLYTGFVKEPYIPAHNPRLELQDETEQRLLDLLRQDGRMSYADLADNISLSRAATRARVLRLIESGVVAVTGMVNPTAFGITQMCGFQIHLSRADAAALTAIKSMPQVDFLARTLGSADAQGTLITRTRRTAIEALDKIRCLEGVRDVESWTHLHLVKEDYDLRPADVLPG